MPFNCSHPEILDNLSKKKTHSRGDGRSKDETADANVERAIQMCKAIRDKLMAGRSPNLPPLL